MTIRRIGAIGGLVAAIMLMASCLSVLFARSVGVATPSAQIDAPAPDFSLLDTAGQTISLRNLRGEVVVLCFTNPRCPVSNEYAARINALTQEFSGRPVKLIAIASGKVVSEPGFINELTVQRRVSGQAFPTLLDGESRVADSYGAAVTPTFYVIGPQGRLRYAGAFDDSRDSSAVKVRYVAEAVEALLNYQSVGTSETAATGCPITR